MVQEEHIIGERLFIVYTGRQHKVHGMRKENSKVKSLSNFVIKPKSKNSFKLN